MADSRYLILVNIPPSEWCYSIDERRQVVGRAADAHIPVPNQFRHVSRRHAEVWRDKHAVCWIQDLNSRTGTQINESFLPLSASVRPISTSVGNVNLTQN